MGWPLRKIARKCKALLAREAARRSSYRNIEIGNQPFKDIHKEAEYWKEVHSISVELQGLGATLLLQGSQADQTTTPFSDIDLVLYGDSTNDKQLALISDLNAIIMRADPLQHHGVFFYDKDILDYYSESILPLATIRKACAIAKSTELAFRVLNDKYTSALTLNSTIATLQRFLFDKTEIRGMWDWKFKVSQFLLIPTLLLAARGLYIYKGESFNLAEPLYSAAAWRPIIQLTEVRERWNQDPSSDPVAFQAYFNSSCRTKGILDQDPVLVPASLALWQNTMFRNHSRVMLDETLNLAGLC